jgi:hypothetical protein
VTACAEQETLQRMSDDLDEVIAVFAKTYAQVAELQRVLQRTCGLRAGSGACVSKPL